MDETISQNSLIQGMVETADRHRSAVIENDCRFVVNGFSWWRRLAFFKLGMRHGLEVAQTRSGEYLGITQHGKWLIGDGVTPRWKLNVTVGER